MEEQNKIIEQYHKIMDNIVLDLKKSEKTLHFYKEGKAEDLAEDYFSKKGFIVYRSRVKKGYRIIGVRYYWKKYEVLLTNEDNDIISTIYNVLGEERFKELAYLIKEKNGCPDLMLIKNKKINFVEVKSNYEEIKSSTLEFFIKINKKYPFYILRIR
jgi:hypothetical protein